MSHILRGDYAAAEDVVQEAFTRALTFYDSYDSTKGELTPWFNTILYNSLRDVQKEMRGQPSENIKDFCVEDMFAEYDLVNSPEKRLIISKHINLIKNEKHKRILELFFLLGYTSTEISQIENKVSVSNVTTVVSRFRERVIKN